MLIESRIEQCAGVQPDTLADFGASGVVDRPKVSVIIPTLNREEPLVRTLGYFLEQEDYRPFEIIVVDQTDIHRPETRRFLAEHGDRLTVLRPDFKNLPLARNLGVEHAKGGIVVFVDDDVVPAPGFLAAHVEPYGDPAVWGVGGPAPKPGCALMSRDQLPPETLRDLDAGCGLPIEVSFDYYASHFLGCNMSFRRSVIGAVGGFDGGFVGSAEGEETEFCLRVRAAGGRLLYHHRAYLVHEEFPEGGCRDVKDTRHAIRNRVHNYIHFNRKVRSMPAWRLRKLRLFYDRSVSPAASGGRRFLSRYYFFSELLLQYCKGAISART